MSEIRSGNLNDLSTPRDFGANYLNEFLQELGDDLTGACMVPVNLPQREIVNIIKRAKKWFYKQYEDSVKENYYIIPKSVFESNYFKTHRALNLPGAGADGGGVSNDVRLNALSPHLHPFLAVADGGSVASDIWPNALPMHLLPRL